MVRIFYIKKLCLYNIIVYLCVNKRTMNEITNIQRKEALEASDRINEELSIKYGGDSTPPHLTVGFYNEHISFKYHLPDSFISLRLDDGVEDDRIYYELTDSYESYYSYIKRKYDMIILQINKYRL